MKYYFEKLKEKLIEIYNSNELDTNKIYDIFIMKNNEDEFYFGFHENLMSFCLYLYYKNSDLQSLTKVKLPFSIEPNLNYQEFCKNLLKYKLYSFDSLIKNDNYYFLIERALVNRGKIYSGFNWKAFAKNTLENQNYTTNNIAYKIYLSIANDSLENFAYKLLTYCEKEKIDYNFKINNNELISRSDSVVIYATKENIKHYINIINNILKNENIKINEDLPHLLAFPYANGVSIAPYSDNGTNSHSGIICHKILKLKEQSISFEDFYDKVCSLMNDTFNKINQEELSGESMSNVKESMKHTPISTGEELALANETTIIDENGIIYDTNGNMIGFIENGKKFIMNFGNGGLEIENDIENETHHIR